nr:hypothetical protein Iba_chr09dCG9370 [Ipomoea batatas]
MRDQDSRSRIDAVFSAKKVLKWTRANLKLKKGLQNPNQGLMSQYQSGVHDASFMHMLSDLEHLPSHDNHGGHRDQQGLDCGVLLELSAYSESHPLSAPGDFGCCDNSFWFLEGNRLVDPTPSIQLG